MSLTHCTPKVGTARIADSAAVLGTVLLGADVIIAQGTVLRSVDGAVTVGHNSAVLENSSVVGTPDHPVRIGQRTVFGHRCQVLGATVGNLCEIGNGSILLPGAHLGDGCVLGEGTLVPAGTRIPDNSVVVGRPGHLIRVATDEDRARIASLRENQLDLIDQPLTEVTGNVPAGATMGTLYSHRDKSPVVADSAILLDSAEITGDVHIGPDTIIGGGVRIIGDSHGPVRIGARVQILENSVLHLLPDNELVIEDDVVIGPGSMIHGCHIGAGTVVEPAAIVCDWSRVGRESVIGAGACVKQRAEFPERSVLDGFPARVVGTLSERPQVPSWGVTRQSLGSLVRLR
ncbi:hypothetical protein F0L68_00090 [Solihabitans fulvus]|uniref:Carbonic anhydrase or acetyltransferase, isoleucine patch superfamily n=1 Tax=Solihabitans fulvus TaxID=1892852 RepID=A0A5B2XTG0_9PSEU|nr:DapH/DapD/GlmU-related protein [Solihabitans fulvus]KAA2266977.1 hypothetical protein F0L68_00090 [Solihabitans fulvus]